MSKASKWVEKRPEKYLSDRGKTWAGVDDEGRLQLFLDVRGWPDGYLTIPPEEILPIARYILDVFGD
jgi:hypothetical protein